MTDKYQIFLVSDSTGETLDRIFLSLQSQFPNFNYSKKAFVFTRTEQQIDKIIKECLGSDNPIILFTIVETRLAKYISEETQHKKVPCFGVLGNLIISFSKILNQRAMLKPSAQHVLDEEYYKRIEAIQFTMSHDDGKKAEDINKTDIVLLGISRTGKTPTSMYLANRGYKTMNIPLVMEQEIPEQLKKREFKKCVVGLYADPERLSDIRKNRVSMMQETKLKSYTDLQSIKKEIDESKKLFKKYNWPTIDITRKSIEETAASIIRIYDINKTK